MASLFRDYGNNLDEEFSKETRFRYADPDEILDPDEYNPNEDYPDIDPDCSGACDRCPDADYCLYGVI